MDHLRVLSRSERQQLADLRDRGGTIGIRAGILLSVQDGLSDREIAERLGTTRQRVSRWRMRMMESEYTSVLELVEDAPRSGRPRLSDGRVLLATAELGGGSADEVGEAAEVSAPTVRSVWRRWEVVSKPDLRSGRGVLAGEIERLAAVYVNPPPDAAFAYWTVPGRGTDAAIRGGADLDAYRTLVHELRAPWPEDMCFPTQRHLEFDAFLHELAIDDAAAELHVVVDDQAILDNDLSGQWRKAPIVSLSAPPEGISWFEYLWVVVAGAARSIEVAAQVSDAAQLALGQAPRHNPRVCWLPDNEQLTTQDPAV